MSFSHSSMTWIPFLFRLLLIPCSLEPTLELPEPSDMAESYYLSGNLIWVFATLWGFFVPALFLFSGLSAKLRKFATDRTQNWLASFALYFLGFWIFLNVLDLPLNYFAGYVREHVYLLSEQTFGKWLADHLKGFVIGGFLTLLSLSVPYWLIRRAPRGWWLITGILAIPYFFLLLMITPIWIEPLFNHFGPMQNKALEKKIVQLAERAGIEADKVFEVNKSVDTKKMNAYATGFLGTKRIVLWDTLLARLTDDEVLSVMGHEMGHFVLHHVAQGILVYSLLTLLCLYFIHWASGPLLARYGEKFGFHSIGDFASLPLLMLLLQFFSFVVTPPGLAFSRHLEHEADRFGLELTRDNYSAMSAEVKFIAKDLAYPWPNRWIKWLRSSHPPAGERFNFYLHYRPWEQGKPLRYSSYFHGSVESPSASP